VRKITFRSIKRTYEKEEERENKIVNKIKEDYLFRVCPCF
jgi:hypothetical protein